MVITDHIKKIEDLFNKIVSFPYSKKEFTTQKNCGS
jgi:hypothetical protein